MGCDGSCGRMGGMEKRLQDVVEAARDLPLEERAAVARELLMPREELSERELRELEREMSARDTLIPYATVRRELGLGAHSKGAKAARRR
jgi:hypothetical protein